MKKFTTEDFIAKSRLVHGDKYDYSKTVYTRSCDKVCIICPVHGEFWQTASSHLSGFGCRKCGAREVWKQRSEERVTFEDFVRRSKESHDIDYLYDKNGYESSHKDAVILCPVHGEFKQNANVHMNGGLCPECRKETLSRKKSMGWDGFLERARKRHGDTYIYPETFEYRNNQSRIPITCRKHGVFWQDAAGHLAGHGCPECDKERRGNKSKEQSELISRFVDKAKKVHGDTYDYSCVEKYERYDKPVPIICRAHGVFMQRPSNHVNGSGCPECAKEHAGEDKILGPEVFKERSSAIHAGKYDYTKVEMTRMDDEVTIICPVHGEFTQNAGRHMRGAGCPKCANQISVGEDEICEYLRSVGIETERRNRTLIKPYELDIVAKDSNIAVEYDGLIWHSERFSEKNSMLKKTEICNEKGIFLIHVFEDEWHNKRPIVEDIISTKMGCGKRVIYARQCKVGDISQALYRRFLENNHIQGYVASKFTYGLWSGDELVGVAGFGKMRKNLGSPHKEGHYEFLRLCFKLGVNVTGGAGKLLKHFEREVKPSKLTSYADRRYSEGKVYNALGFTHVRNSRPNYYYVVNKKRENRFKYRKDALVRQGFDPSKSEHEIMMGRCIYRIYDCGCMVFEKNYI